MVRKLSVKYPAAFCYGDEENARIYAVYLTTANQGKMRRAQFVSVMATRKMLMEQTEREKKEQAYITQLKKSMNPEDVAGVYHLYQKLTEKSYFRTDVGFGFLAELREYLVKNGYQIDIYTTPRSPANKKVSEEHAEAHLRRKYDALCEKQEQTEQEVERLNLIRIRLTIAVVALAAVVIGMLFITVTNKNVGYFHAEQKIQDKYSYWEEQLDVREKELQEWEKELGEQAEKMNETKTQN